MSGVSGPSKRKPAAWMEHGLLVLLQCAEQLHVHVPPEACAIEIDSTPSAVGTVVGTAVVGVGVGAAVPAKRMYGPCTDKLRETRACSTRSPCACGAPCTGQSAACPLQSLDATRAPSSTRQASKHIRPATVSARRLYSEDKTEHERMVRED